MERFRLDDPDAAEKAARVHEHGVDPDEDVPWNDVRRMEAVLAAMDPSLRRITQADADAAALAAVDDLIDRCQMWRRKRKVEQPHLPTRSQVEARFRRVAVGGWPAGRDSEFMVTPRSVASVLIDTGWATEDPEPEIDERQVGELAKLLALANGSAWPTPHPGDGPVYREQAAALLAAGVRLPAQVTP